MRTVGWESSSFTWAKACSWFGPQIHVFPLLSSSRSGCVSVARFGENFPSWMNIPKNLQSSGTFSGGFIRRMAEVLSGSARMPLPSMMCPRNFSSVRENSHFSGLRVAPVDSIRLRTALIWLSCSSWSLPKTRTSSIWHTKSSRPLRIADIHFWKCSGALEIPNGSLLKWKRPNGVMKVVRRHDDFSRGICQKPLLASGFEKTLAPVS